MRESKLSCRSYCLKLYVSYWLRESNRSFALAEFQLSLAMIWFKWPLAVIVSSFRRRARLKNHCASSERTILPLFIILSKSLMALSKLGLVVSEYRRLNPKYKLCSFVLLEIFSICSMANLNLPCLYDSIAILQVWSVTF